MTAILALLPGILALIPSISNGVEQLIALIGSIRTAAQQTGEWSPELETQFLNALLATKTDPAWQPDPKPVVPTGGVNSPGPQPDPTPPVALPLSA